MTIIKPIVFASLILAALSATQMDAFARGHEGRHEGPRPFEHQEVPHTTNNPGARPSGAPPSQASRHRGPEVVVPGGATVGARPEALKTETSCTHNPNDPTCVK
jgi:hypothetical protein